MSVPDPRVGTVLQGRYKVLDRRTEGSMGVVYRGERVQLGRPVAIKFLNEGYAATEDGRRRFEVEARAMSRLEHPNCVPVTDFGVDQGSPYLVMDFVSGQNLRQLLVAEWRLEPMRAVAIMRQVLAGIAHAHVQGIIHRDLKPENIIVSPVEGHGEHARILDFGLAKLRDEGSFTTGVAVGTPGYMSPEQTSGQKADERADIYACGVILYELLCGQKPFHSESAFETMRMHREVPPRPLAVAAVGAQVPAALDAIVMKALAKSRDDRFASASEFRAALEQLESAPPPRATGGNRKTMIIGGAIAGVIAIGVVASKPWASGGAAAPAVAPAAIDAREEIEEHANNPPPSPVDAAPAPAATLDAAPAPPARSATANPDEIARMRALADHEPRAAIAGLETLTTAYPDDPAAQYALAAAYARAHQRRAAVQRYAVTLRLAPEYKDDATLLDDVVAALGDNTSNDLAAALIEQAIGASAIPHLETATHSHSRSLRYRATKLLAKLR
ncbi:MAG TPA: serine/threonine-protein kinase [Kofleriaceae bacterium]|nr:serine/threonine-protein kinase [Kofleriaceae bacterium]